MARPPRVPSGIRAALGALALLRGSGGRAGAVQAQATIDLGGLAVRYDGVTTMGGARVAPVVRHTGDRFYFEVGGSGAQFEDGTWSADGGGLAAWRTGAWAGLTPELIGYAGLAGARGSDATTGLGATARLHRAVGPLDLFAGGGVAWNDGVIGTRTLTTAELGAVLESGGRQVSLLLAPGRGEGIRYTDLSLYARREGRLTLEVTGGLRAITLPERSDHGWVAGSAALDLGSRFTLIGTAGNFPPDPAQGFPGGRFAALGLRLGRSTRTALRPTQTAPLARPLPWPGAAFQVVDKGDGEREVVVTAPQATSVEVAGDFTDWRPVALVRDGDRWRLRLPIAPGVHRLNLRLDGGAWRVPPGIGRGLDEFGGEVGILATD